MIRSVSESNEDWGYKASGITVNISFRQREHNQSPEYRGYGGFVAGILDEVIHRVKR